MSSYIKTINYLIKNNITISIVESCTGGLLSYNFIKHKGVSGIFKAGLVCYSNSSKTNKLNIKKEYIEKYGAVSFEVAKKMTMNLSKIENTNLSIATTGIAGPTGQTKNKPIGLVYVGIKYKKRLLIYKKIFKGTRIQIQRKTVNFIFTKIKDLI